MKQKGFVIIDVSDNKYKVVNITRLRSDRAGSVFNLDGVVTVMIIPVFALPQLPGVVMTLARPVFLLVVLAGQDVNQQGELETH